MASKIGKALGFSMPEAESEEPADEADSEAEPKGKGGSGEVVAMRAFMSAETAEAKAEAMKAFVELCGGY